MLAANDECKRPMHVHSHVFLVPASKVRKLVT
jgi:hypothetical protein